MKREYWLQRYSDSKELFAFVDSAIRVQSGKHPSKNFCRVAEWHGMIRQIGPIGLKPRFDALVRKYAMPPLEEDALRIALMDLIPPCYAGKNCDHRVDYFVEPISPEKQALIDAGKYLVWKRGVTTPEDLGFAPPDDKYAPNDIDQMVEEAFPEVAK